MRSNNWGRNLLAAVGVALILTGLALVVLLFVTRTSGLVAAPGTSILGIGILLVVMAAFYESSGGSARLPGWRLRFGKAERDDPNPPD